MKKTEVAILALAAALLICSPSYSATESKMAVGGYLGGGFGFAAGDGPEEYSGLDRDDRTGKFSGAFGAYFDYCFTPLFAIEAGLGFHSHGIHWKWDDGDFYTKTRHFYMELPVMARFNIKNFQLAAGLTLSFALSGKTSLDLPFLGSDENTWSGDDWDWFHRVNIGPEFHVGYSIPVGPVRIVPFLSWSIHLINDLDRNEIEDDLNINADDYRSRYNNLLLNVAVEYAF